MSEAVLQACDLGRRHRQGPLDVTVLASVDLSVAAGESVAIVGASGSGKSSLLHVLAGLDRPTQGRVLWQGQDVATLTASQVASRRNHWLGFVFQFHHLLSEFNALENVALPLWIRRTPKAEARAMATQALASVGLGDRWQHRPAELSGGERQRVALARALVTQPACLLADEPTGNLDRASADLVFDLLQTQCRQANAALVLVTHDDALARRCDRMLRLVQGRLTQA
jgi:lipoprotein-releasing system ATP-binding protein